MNIIWEVRHSVTLSDSKLSIIKRAIYLHFKCMLFNNVGIKCTCI